jgi:hypothetical protein
MGLTCGCAGFCAGQYVAKKAKLQAPELLIQYACEKVPDSTPESLAIFLTTTSSSYCSNNKNKNKNLNSKNLSRSYNYNRTALLLLQKNSTKLLLTTNTKQQ